MTIDFDTDPILADSTTTAPSLHHLRRSGVSLVVDTGDGALPRILYWGAELGALDDQDLAALAVACDPPRGHNLNDVVVGSSVLPAYESGWLGRPGVSGSRCGKAWSPAFRLTALEVDDVAGADARLVARAADPVAGLDVVLEIELLSSGLLRTRADLDNTDAAEPYEVDAVRVFLPVPTRAAELLDLTGRWARERIPQRSPFVAGLHSREARGGRTGLDAATILAAGEPGFGFRSGEVWAMHVGYSGNQELYAESIYNGAHGIGGAELLQPGEMRLAPGERYATPWIYGSHGVGLDRVAERFHTWMRSRPEHPTSPRPVLVNTWEAVYFDHDLPTLRRLADKAAAVGAERFVLDDGWFGSRRDDRRGLGDWVVSDEVWPDGLGPLIDHVFALGMDFGLWVEPEMVNLDSELARTHPDWLFSAGGRAGFPSRNQHVLDLTHPEAYTYILERLDALLTEYAIAFLKWDHNRLLTEAGHTPGGEPAIHGQTYAVYELMAELKRRHPGLEIESCASGGGRVDLGVMELTDRVWASDNNDPIDRSEINRYTGLLLPPEVIGADIGPSPSHTTGRSHSLGFRAGVAIWGHLGIQLDLTTFDDGDLEEVARWVSFYKENRALLHGGVQVTCDHPIEEIQAHGVVAQDGSRALFAVTNIGRAAVWPPGLLQLPGLDPERRYRVRLAAPADTVAAHEELPAWTRTAPVLSGRVLAESGVQLLPAYPENLYVIELTASDVDQR